MESLQALVVDDNWYNCDIFRIALEKLGYEVEIAYNGQDGLDFLMNKSYHILILDLQMPGLNGLQVLQEISHSPIRQHMYILVVTANAFMATDELEALCDMVMFKPIDVPDFTRFLQRIKGKS